MSGDSLNALPSARTVRKGRRHDASHRVSNPSFDLHRRDATVGPRILMATLIMTNVCVHRAERIALLMLLSEEFPNFVRDNPPPSVKSQDQAPLADEARQFFANGEPALADRYFPWLVNLMSPAYWIYLAMAVTILFNASGAYSRFRLWRIDANRQMLESRLKALTGLGSTPEHVKTLPPEAVIKTPQNRKAAEDLMKDLEALHLRCQEQLRSMVTPMGSEMFYRYQESLIEDAQAMLADLLRRSGGGKAL